MDTDGEKAAVLEWLAFERQQAFAGTDYAIMMHSKWKSLPNAIERVCNSTQQKIVFNSLPPSLQNYTRYLLDSFQEQSNDVMIPGYHGLLERALDLCKLAAKFATGQSYDKIIVTTLSTNQRYAAVYQPHVAPSWYVIALDWGVICGIISMAVCFAKCLPTKSKGNGAVFIFDEKKIRKAAQKPLMEKLAKIFLPPAIRASNNLPMPLLIDGPKPQNDLIAAMIINGLLFSVVAHEFGHILNSHIEETNVGEERRMQMEYDADSTALMLTLANPWKLMTDIDEPSIPLLTSGCLALMFSYLRMLEMGDRILEDLGHSKIKTSRTHPAPLVRWDALIDTLAHLPLPQETKELIFRAQAPMLSFGEALWDRSVESIHALLVQGVVSQHRVDATTFRGATLKFL